MPNEETNPPIKALIRYRERVTDDPLRLSILAAHALIEEMIELVIEEAFLSPEFLHVQRMPFWRKFEIVRALEPTGEATELLWDCIEKLTNLRNAAAHRDYETLRDERFRDLAEFFYPDPAYRHTEQPAQEKFFWKKQPRFVPDIFGACNRDSGNVEKPLRGKPL